MFEKLVFSGEIRKLLFLDSVACSAGDNGADSMHMAIA